jgi:hypothetical protein
MRIACWITKATNTHSEYVILIAFPPQQWLHVRASVLLYMYSACLVVGGLLNLRGLLSIKVKLLIGIDDNKICLLT